jgi:hypothetical protein
LSNTFDVLMLWIAPVVGAGILAVFVRKLLGGGNDRSGRFFLYINVVLGVVMLCLFMAAAVVFEQYGATLLVIPGAFVGWMARWPNRREQC